MSAILSKSMIASKNRSNQKTIARKFVNINELMEKWAKKWKKDNIKRFEYLKNQNLIPA